jgi:Rrf2 family nitric oxide-sensitive transcriptional repressor
MKVPQSYLSKVLQSLVRGGLVISTRGLNGGFVLSRPPAEISMLDIMNAVNPIQRIESCPLDVEAQSADLCPLHRRLDEAMAHVQEAFAATSLAELLSEENPCPTMRQQLTTLAPLKDLK